MCHFGRPGSVLISKFEYCKVFGKSKGISKCFYAFIKCRVPNPKQLPTENANQNAMRSPINTSASGRQLASLACLLAMVCLVGDRLMEFQYHGRQRLLEAVIDNMTHAAIGAVAMAIVCLEFGNRLTIIEHRLLLSVAYFTAASMDVDHFVEAHSWYLFVSSCQLNAMDITDFRHP